MSVGSRFGRFIRDIVKAGPQHRATVKRPKGKIHKPREPKSQT
jgi:hypothetical protein